MPPHRFLASTAAAVTLLIAVPGLSPAALPEVPAPMLVASAPASRVSLPLTSSDGRQARLLLNAANAYALGPWWRTVAPALANEVRTSPSTVGVKTDAVRRLSMESLSLATSLTTGAYDPTRSGASTARARSVAVELIRVVVQSYRTNRPAGWGGQWQAPLWESLVGRAAWMLWDDLDAATKQKVRTMVISAADSAALTPPIYLRNKAGVLLRPGNTGAEEDSWSALPLQLATVMLPVHPHWTAWRYADVRLELASWVRPQDVTSKQLVNGAPVASWVNGSNVEANGAVVNHDRVAPDYSTNAYQNVDEILLDALAGVPAPESAKFGLEHVYAGLTSTSFSGKGFRAPGGTVYQGNRIYYPQGCEWGTAQALPYALLDAEAAAFGFGGSVAPREEAAHIGNQMRMLNRFKDGRTYGAAREFTYPGREEHVAQLAAQYYLTKLVRDHHLATFTSASYFAPITLTLLGAQVQPVERITDRLGF